MSHLALTLHYTKHKTSIFIHKRIKSTILQILCYMKFQALGSMPNFTYAMRIAKADINTHLKFNLTFKWFKGQDMLSMSCTANYWIFFYICDIFSCYLKVPSCIFLPRYSLPVKAVSLQRMSQRCRQKRRLLFMDQPLIHLLTTACFFPLLSVSWGHDVPKERMELVHGTAGSKVCWPVFATGWM